MTDARYEIIVEVNGQNRYLDTYKYEPVTLTYNVADIQDISKRNSSFSRTITIPETQNNRDVFNNISDLAADSTFNPNLKSKAWILVDTVEIFKGYIQLKSVTLSDTLENKYEVVIFADNDTFFTRLGESYIEELDYNDLNHIYGTTSVIDSWTSGQELGYFYPLIDYGQGWTIDMISPGGSFLSATNSFVNLEEMLPATYVKTIWDKIFNESNFYYQSDFLNSQKFKDLLIPFNGSSLNNGPTYSLTRIFQAFQDSATISSWSGLTYSGDSTIYGYTDPNDQFNPNAPLFEYSSSTTLRFTDEINSDNVNTDPNGLWSTTDFVYTHVGGIFSERFTTSMDVVLINSIWNPSFVLEVYFYRQNNPSTGLQDSTWASGRGFSFGTYEINAFGQTNNGQAYLINAQYPGTRTLRFIMSSPWLDGSTLQRTPLANGEKVRVVLKARWRTGYVPSTGEQVAAISTGYILNEVAEGLILGQEIEYFNSVPKKIKQKDFITSIIKMFNLYIEPSKDYDNTLIIEPRDEYYASGQIKDWTDKIDLNVDIQQQVLADTQNRQIIFTYKDDKDRLNTLYKSTYNEIYGQYLYDSENEFSKGDKKIDVIFSPTPVALVPGSFNFPIPRIVKDDVNYNQLPGGRIDPNIRIVRRWNDGNDNGLLPFNNEFDNWAFEGIAIDNGYPYVGHYDNPYVPTDDINWGQLKEQYFPSTIVTDDNLVNNYWIKFLDETMNRNSRIITVEMYLTPVDINNFRFNDSIYLFFNGSGHYYKVNKISNYDPGLIKTCQVELIKSLDRPKFKRTIRKYQKPTSVLTTFSSNVINLRPNNTVVSAGSITTGIDNVIRGNDIISNGSNNIILSKNVLSNGDDNSIFNATKSIIVNGDANVVGQNSIRLIINGDSNTISDDNDTINISGSNNIVGTNSNNIQLIGNNNTIGGPSYSFGITSSIFGTYSFAVPTTNVQVFGNNNTIYQGITGSFIIGNGVTATQSNITYIGNDVVITGGGSLPPSDLQGVLDVGSTANISTDFTVTSTSGNPDSIDLVAFDTGDYSSLTLNAGIGIGVYMATNNGTIGGGSISIETVDNGSINLTSNENDIKLKTFALSTSTQPNYVEINVNEKKWARTTQKTTTGTGFVNSDLLCGLGSSTTNTPTLIRGVIVIKNGTSEQIVTFDDAYDDAGNQLNPGSITVTGYGPSLLGGLTSFMTGTNDYYLILQGVSGTTTYDIISITTYSL
jgi:hypothetical protein